MKTFGCRCGNRLHFENTVCLTCGSALGFLPDDLCVSALREAEDGQWIAAVNGRVYRQCANFREHQVCNWMVPGGEAHAFCASCRLNDIIPSLDEGNNRVLWYRVEQAKRRLIYTLCKLGLPVEGRDVCADSGLAFRFMRGQQTAEFDDALGTQEHVITGHAGGTITINLAEAEPDELEKTRVKMNERYRTLLGHFRHESGHYYWDRLVRDTYWLVHFRKVFGDERADYQQSLDRYYANGPVADWESGWISAYASSHPWEDFAESWAHYLHMVDTLETANDYGFSVHGQEPAESPAAEEFALGYFSRFTIDELIADWSRLTAALNAMNRSMGLPDAYPFVLSEGVIGKLALIHQIVATHRHNHH